MGPVRGNGPRGLVSDINVTPLVDVMLVLLIIFMVTAPMMTQGLNVDLPETTDKALVQKDKEPIVVTVDKDKNISLGRGGTPTPVSLALLKDQLGKENEETKKNPIFLNADKNVSYGTVVDVMDAIKKSGFDKLGMVTKPSEKEK
jgi:biopolymer transport protein TolR